MYIKNVLTNFLWVLNFYQVGDPDAKIQKYPLGPSIWRPVFQKLSPRGLSKFLNPQEICQDILYIYMYI